MSTERPRLPFIARNIRRFSVFIILAWLAAILIATLASVGGNWAAAIPALERVGEEHSVSLMPQDAPSVQAMRRIGKDFKESASDMQHSGNRSILKITAVTVAIIFTMLLLVYRSAVTVILLLTMVGVELAAARGIVAFLGHNEIIVLSTFSVNMLVFLCIAAGTDYGIFFFGRYQEARQAGEDRVTAYYSTYRGVAPVVLASGLTIAGAIFCLSFSRLPYFQTMGIPCAVGMLTAVAVAVTLVPAGIVVASRFGLLEPKRQLRVHRWRGIGTATVRWPAPILAATCAIALVGLLTLPGYETSYNDRLYIPKDIPANLGYAAAERHFSQARMMPDILMIETDHDMRNPANFLVLNKLV